MRPYPVAPGGNDSGFSQIRQMAGNLRLVRADDLDEKAHANFRLAHQIEQPQPRVIGERGKEQFHIKRLFAFLFAFHHRKDYITYSYALTYTMDKDYSEFAYMFKRIS